MPERSTPGALRPLTNVSSIGRAALFGPGVRARTSATLARLTEFGYALVRAGVRPGSCAGLRVFTSSNLGPLWSRARALVWSASASGMAPRGASGDGRGCSGPGPSPPSDSDGPGEEPDLWYSSAGASITDMTPKKNKKRKVDSITPSGNKFNQATPTKTPNNPGTARDQRTTRTQKCDRRRSTEPAATESATKPSSNATKIVITMSERYSSAALATSHAFTTFDQDSTGTGQVDLTAQQELPQAAAGAHQITADVLSAADQVAQLLVLNRWDAHEREFSSRQSPREPDRVALVDLDPIGGGRGRFVPARTPPSIPAARFGLDVHAPIRASGAEGWANVVRCDRFRSGAGSRMIHARHVVRPPGRSC